MKAKHGWLDSRVVLVTGGAGFIGSHLVDALMAQDVETHVLDNLSSGSLENNRRWLAHSGFKFFRGDLLDKADIENAIHDCQVIFHLAANPEVRLGSVSPGIHFEQNIKATYNLLEAVRQSATTEVFVFTSSSTVYGDASTIPTPEDYAPLEPISVYGATKLASEALITAYAHTYGLRATIFRLANVIGPRSRHGVIPDFAGKLKENPRELEILGDGTQTKSYLYVEDCIKALLLDSERLGRRVEVFNLGSEDWTDAKTIAEIVVEEMGLRDVAFRFTGGVNGGRGWKGDVKYMLLAVDKLKSLGWKPERNSAQAVRATARIVSQETK